MVGNDPQGASRWDAFLSYSRRDQAKASLIHAFLQTYPLPGGRPRLRIFRDTADLTARNLTDALPEALSRATTLLVCCSPHARASGWVGREITSFQSGHGAAARVTPLLLEGDLADALPAPLAEAEPLVLDLRQGWRLGLPRPATRLELLRAVAAIADIPLRDLVPWDAALRRRRLILGGSLAAAVLAIVAVTGTGWWIQSVTAETTAMRRRAESALLQLGAGDVPRAVATLGHVLGRGGPAFANDYGEVLRFWLYRLTDSREITAEAARQEGGALLRFNGRSFLPEGPELPLDEPFEVVRDVTGHLLAAGREEVTLFTMPGLRPLLRLPFPARLDPTGFAASPAHGAIVVAARQLETTNDEDEPTERPTCRVVVLREAPASAATPEAGLLVRQRGEGGSVLASDCQVGVNEQPGAPDDGQGAAAARIDAAWLPQQGLEGPGIERLRPLPRFAFPRLKEEATVWRQEQREAPNLLHAGRSLHPLYLELLPRLSELSEEVTAGIDFDGFDGCYNACGAFPVAAGHILWSFYVSGNSYVTLAACLIGAPGSPGQCWKLQEFLTINTAFAAGPDSRSFARASQHRGDVPLSLHVVEEGRAREIPLDRMPTGEIVNLAFATSPPRLLALTANDEIWIYAIESAKARLERRVRLGATIAGREAACRELVHGQERRLRHLPLLAPGGPIAVVDSQCGMVGVDPGTGDLLWRLRLSPPAPNARLDLVGSSVGGVFGLVSGETFRLFHARTGAPLTDEVNLTLLIPGGDAQQMALTVAPSGEILVEAADGHRAVRAAPPDLGAMREMLVRLHGLTGISSADGATPLAAPPR